MTINKMTNHIADISLCKAAKIAGAWYLLLAVTFVLVSLPIWFLGTG